MKLVCVVVLLIAAVASAKDHSNDYRMGTLSRLTVKSGWLDTTVCSGDVGNIRCSGGIQDVYSDVYLLTMNDGKTVVIHHTVMRPDTVKGLADGSKILYRMEHKRGLVGVDYVLIPSADNPKKEGWYYLDSHWKNINKTTPVPTDGNLKAMCESDKLSPELKAQYCK